MTQRDHLRKGEDVAVWRSLVAGSLSGLTARFGTAPMDTIKIRLQIMPLQSGEHFGIFDVIRDIMKKEGIRGLWKGNVPGSILYVIYGGTQFGSYSMFNTILSPIGWSAPVHSFIVGALSGATSCVTSYPFDVLRTRFVADRNIELSSITKTLREILHEKGVKGFFKGCTSSIVTITMTTSIMFSVYESIKIHCEHWKTMNDSHWISALDHCAGPIGGVVSKMMTFPLDTARRRMLIGHSPLAKGLTTQVHIYESYKEMGLLRIGATILRREGIYALYRGVTMALFKSVPSTTICLYSYEWFIKCISG